ncbi:MAG: CHAT domain-containing protein [Spirulinaceae cyanobacterium]
MRNVLTVCLAVSTLWLAILPRAQAQNITPAPDGTGTIIQHQGHTYHIQGGTQAGANLFHSFQEFGLSAQEIANFWSDPTVVNIFGRVVGGDRSIIDGLIQANPNLYLMNPAGIVFGANAQLNVGGDFFATTADQICFASGCFNAMGANHYSNLLGSPNTFGFLQNQPGGLVNAGILAVQKGKSVHLSGGTVVNLGAVVAPGGVATIAAIPGQRQVRLAQLGNVLSLEVADTVLTEGIAPLDLPELLAAAPTGLDLKAIATPLGNLTQAGTVQATQVDLYAAGQVNQAATGSTTGSTRVVRFSEQGDNPTQAVFIDERVEQSEALLYGAEAGTVTQVIGKDEKGVAVVTEQLAVISESVGELDSVAIVAEGNAGSFWLGQDWLRSENIGDHAAQLGQWREALTERADLLLYSCFTALGATGETFVNQLANLTGADVAASVDATSSTHYGGDWKLEHNTGAIEATTPFTSETLGNWTGKLAIRTVQNLNDMGAGSLRDALMGTGGPGSFWTAAVADGDEINFAPGVVGQIDIGNEINWTTNNLTLDGPGQNDLILDGGGAGRLFNISAENATIRNITIQNGNESGFSSWDAGGGVYHSGVGELRIENAAFLNNSTQAGGGGVSSRGIVRVHSSIFRDNFSRSGGGGFFGNGDATISASIINNNSSSFGSGGGVNVNGDLIVYQSEIVNNTTYSKGGGIYVSMFGSLIVNNSIVSGNSTLSPNTSSQGEGGGIYSRGTIEITNSTLLNNSATSSGGAIGSEADVTITDSLLSGNSSSSGGAIGAFSSVTDVDLAVTSSTISNNYAEGGGGGIWHAGGTVTLTSSRLLDNFTPSNGGGIWGEGNVTVHESIVSGNSAAGYGGGIHNTNGQGETTVTSSTISNNSAGNSGGGINNFRLGNIMVDDSIISGNSSGSRGGGIDNKFGQGDVIANDSIISGNSSGSYGGGIYNGAGNITLSNTPLVDNQAGNIQNNGIRSTQGEISISSDGDLDLTDSIQSGDFRSTPSISLSGNNINLSIPIQSEGGDIFIDARDSVNALTSDATLSSSRSSTAGDITIIAGGDINLRNIVATGSTGDGGDISITSIGGIANTTFGGSAGLIDASSRNRNAGNVEISTADAATIGQIFAESRQGSGGNVSIDTSGLVHLKNKGPGLLGITDASISTAGRTAGGTITIRHGGLGQIPFTIGDANINGSAGSLSTRNTANQTLSPTQSFLYGFSQGGIQIVTADAPIAPVAPVLGSTPVPIIHLPQLDANPPILSFYEQSSAELFVQLIGARLGATTRIDVEDNKFAWDIPGEAIAITGDLPLPRFEGDVGAIDDHFSDEYADYFNLEQSEEIEGMTLANIREMLTRIEAETDTRPVMVYALSYPDALELILITAQDTPLIRRVIPAANAPAMRYQTRRFLHGVQRPGSDRYLDAAQQLHQWLIAPIQAELDAYEVDTLLFALSPGLRTLPLAALHDGNQFLIEQYSLGQVPSVSLTNSAYQPLHTSPVVAMGASEFRTLAPLPAVPVELARITANQMGQSFLNEAFTFEALGQASRNHGAGIVHLATHATFTPGRSDRAFIQFWEQKVQFPDLRRLGWYDDPQMELLVLSACETALGDRYAELGFAGLAVQTGVKSALASLWRVSDLGTLALMTDFYDQLRDPEITIKAEALRQAQLGLLRGAVDRSTLADRPVFAPDADPDFSHPYYWSAFTLVGSPW